MPAAFFGHGSPMNAVDRNRYTDAWRAFRAEVPRPTAILVVSAHWYINATAVTAVAKSKTIPGGRPHVRDEGSTFTWLLEPMIRRDGFEVLQAGHSDTAHLPRCLYRGDHKGNRTASTTRKRQRGSR